MGKIKDYLLGGSSTYVAGDGRVFVSTDKPSTSHNIQSLTIAGLQLSSPNSSISNISMDSTRHDNSGPGHSRVSSGRTSPNPPPISPDHASDNSRFECSEQIERHEMAGEMTRVSSGVRAPRSSLAPPSPPVQADESPRPSIESFYTASQVSIRDSDVPENTPWQDYEIPEELGMVNEDAPTEIRNIVQESLDEHRVLRISRMQATALTKLTTDESTNNLAILEAADEIPELEDEDDGHLNAPPRHTLPSRNASQRSVPFVETASTSNMSRNMSDLQRRFQESRRRTRKGSKILPGPKINDQPTPPLLKVEQTVSECISCYNDIPKNKAIDLPCHHSYCQTCFSHLISTAIHSENTFPPKCCLSEVPKSTIHRHLPAKEWKAFSEKALEYAVPVANRYYCASPKCAKWIDARNAKLKNGALECPHCKAKLCTVCRGPSHPSNEDCPQDFGMDRLMEEAELSGWRRCSKCRRMVERVQGCLHITCMCRHQFCYCCGTQWQSCRCNEGDYNRQEEERRVRRAAREAEQRAEEEEVRAAIVAVEEAERAIQQEREAEEARMADEVRQLEKIEAERLSNIVDYYEYLRGVLECVRSQQRHALEKRHDEEWAEIDRIRDDIESPNMTAARECIVNTEKATIVGEIEAKIKELQRSHAHAMMEIITRNRRAQDELLAASMSAPDAETEITLAAHLESMIPVQEAMRSELKAQQQSEVQKLRAQHDAQLEGFDAKSKILRLRRNDLEDIRQREKILKTRHTADSKWFELLFSERITMLTEDQNRMMNSGADSPPLPTKRDTVVVPKSAEPEPAPTSSAAAAASASTPTISVLATMSMRETLGIPTPPMPSPTSPTSPTTPLRRTQRTHRANSGRSARREGPNWDEIHAIANGHGNGHGGDARTTHWHHHGGLGAGIRVG